MKKTVMAKSSEDLSSKRHFHWTTKVTNEEEQQAPTLNPSTTAGDKKEDTHEEPKPELAASASSQRRKLQTIAVSRLRSVLTTFRKNMSHSLLSLGPQVVGTLFGHRHGHVHMAFQKDAASEPAFLIELATPISGLVREMVSGLARIALECDKEDGEEAVGRRKLLEEPRWRAYCNGKKCRFAARRECGPREWKVLKVVEPISMGAGVLPGNDGDGDGDGDGGGGGGGEIMYMRAKFERVVGSRDSEAFYMMNPDNNGTPELSIYLLRV